MKPTIIAWSEGLSIIPFENILSVLESRSVTGGLEVEMNGSKSTHGIVNISPNQAQAFVDKYNNYLSVVEGLTMTMVVEEDLNKVVMK